MTRRDRYVQMLVDRIMATPRAEVAVEAQVRLAVNTIISDAQEYQQFHKMPYPFSNWCDSEEEEE